MQQAPEATDNNVENNTLTIRSQLEAVKSLLKFAEKQYQIIEYYYQYADNGEIFRSPMNVQANNCGDSGRSNFPSQQYAFYLARDMYFQLCKDFWDRAGLQKKLKKMKELYDDWCLETESDSRTKLAHAVEDETGRRAVGVSPIPDHFYPAYLEFGRRLEEINTNLDKISKNPKAWLNELKFIFTNHARTLIHKGRMKPDHFQKALDSYNEERKLPVEERKDKLRKRFEEGNISSLQYQKASALINSQSEVEDCCIDFDYLYEVSTMFSVYTGSGHSVTANGKFEIVMGKYSIAELIDKLKGYLATVMHQDVIEIFFEVFNDVYLKEVECFIAQRAAMKPDQNSGQRWNSRQFWSAEQQEHQKSMAPALAAINALNEGADDVTHENLDTINKL